MIQYIRIAWTNEEEISIQVSGQAIYMGWQYIQARNMIKEHL